jgi:ribosomal protein S18 acetylase RimI-like enzyme
VREKSIQIELATPEHLPDIMTLIRDCTLSMQQQGIDQWGDYYPTLEIFAEDIRTHTLWLAWQRQTLLGMIVLNEDQVKEWESIQWMYQGPALIVHRLAVHPKRQRQGIAHQLMEFAEDHARKNDYVSIRLDAYTGNPASLRLYQTRGYRNAGQVQFTHRSLPGYCFEKQL